MGIFGVPKQGMLRVFGVGVLVSSAVSVSLVAASAPEASAVVAAPTVSGIAPAVGPVEGGQQVLIWGTGFATSGTITVTINGAACTGAALALGGNATAVKCTTGAATEGIGNVVVTNPDTQSGTLTNGFTYVGAGETEVLAWGYKGLGGNDVPEINYGSNLRLQRLATPIDSTGALSGRTVVGLSSGANAQHACALADNGRAYCWGLNASGQLGDGTTDVRRAPIEVSVSGVLSGKSLVSIAAAYSGSSSDGFTCAVSTEGKVYCWGYNAYGQLGDNSTTNRTSPVAVATGAASGKVFVDVKVGSDHACGLTSDGKVYCWGNNDYGQLGNNSTTSAKTPVAVNTSGTLSGKTVSAITLGLNFSCAVTTEGKVSCWGSNSQYEMGVEGASPKVPQLIGASTDLATKTVAGISAGWYHTCATTSDGAVYCWGRGDSGQLGIGTNPDSYAPTAPTAVDTTGVMNGVAIAGVAAGANHTCAWDASRRTFCWGDNANWELGTLETQYPIPYGYSYRASSPLLLDSATRLRGTRMLAMHGASTATLALVTTVGAGARLEVPARLVGWGLEDYLGTGLTDYQNGAIGIHPRLDPNGVLTGTTIEDISGSCVLTAAGTVACWKGDGALTAVDQTGLLDGKTITQLAAANFETYSGHACVLTSDNGIYCWGKNSGGELGNDTKTDSATPVAVKMDGALDGKTVSNLFVGPGHTCVITSDNGLYCWGSAAVLTGSSLSDAKQPLEVDTTALAGKTMVKVSMDLSKCVLTSDGLAYCWGPNAGSSAAPTWAGAPLAVETSGALDGKQIADIGASSSFTCALTTDSGVYCWGNYGNAGVNSKDPALVDAGDAAGKTLTQLSNAGRQVCVLDTEGAVYCWGSNQYRETGVADTFTYPKTPTKVDTYGIAVQKVQAVYTYTIALTKPLEGGDPAPVVSSVTPSSGVVLGGTDITVTGSNFATTGTVVVTVGGVECTNVTVNSSSEITCTTPAAASGGAVNVTVKNPDNKSGTGTNAFTYIGPPTVTKVEPAAGPIEGGTAVTITGTGFLAGAAVTFGGTACESISVDSATSISCTTPANSLGAVDVVVTNTDTQSGSKTNGFLYGDAVTAVSPTGGSTAGGTSVTLTGTGFVNGATVTIGGTACTSVSFTSSTSLTCTTPAGTAGLADIVVTNPDTKTISGDDLFEYVAVPTVTSVSPTSGNAGESTALVISGTNFSTTGTVTVTVGGGTCTNVDVVSATQVNCDSPAGAAGTVDIVVTNPYSLAGTGEDLFEFVPAPTVTSVLPTLVGTAGGTTITVTGTGFRSGASVTVYGSECGTVNVVNSTTITCSSPELSTGTYDIEVTNTDEQSGTGTNLLSYAVGPTITSVYPAVRVPAGGSGLQIFGTGFATTGTVTVTVGGTNCPIDPAWTSASSLKCTLPAGTTGYATVVVTNPDTLAASATDKFRYQPKADISSVLPAFGPLAGGTKVTVFGSGFDAIGTVRLKIGGTACLSVVVVSAAELTCTTPASTLGKKGIEVENVDLNSDSVFVADLFEYADTKSIIARLYANGGSRDIKRMQDLAQKVLDGMGSCSKDLAKFGDELAKLVAAKKMTQATAQTLAAFSFGDCLPQLPATPPASAPVRAQLAPSPAELLVAPVCTTTLSNSAVTLDLSSPDALLTLYSYSRENFEWAAMWIRIDGGAWGPAIGLSPTNGSGFGIGWSSDLVRSLLQVGGVFRLGGNRTYSVELAVGTGSTGDPYVADAQVCTQTFSVFVGELPLTGSNAGGPLRAATWVTLTGALLAAVGIRRRRPTALKR